jgi:dihydropyrimidinase
MKKLLSGGQVWQEDAFRQLDVLVENGIVVSVSENINEPSAETIDCRGSYLIPALCDMHVHVGEKVCGLDLADDFASLSQLADNRGIGAIGAFVTERSDPANRKKSLKDQYEQVKSRAGREFKHTVHWHLTPTISEVKDVYPLLQEGCDLKFYTTYKPNGIYRSYKEIARWMQNLKDLKPRMLVHCEDDEIVTVMSSFHPFNKAFDHAQRRPEMAEILAVERILDLAIQYNYPVHIVHVSAPEAALLIRQAKKSAPVTCETAPHYLLLNDTVLQGLDGHRWLCTPPIRSEKSRGMLVELLQDGLFDTIATDHCPYKKADKDLNHDFPAHVPVGLAGLGATLPVLYENLVKTGKLPLQKLVPLLSTNPARLMNLYPHHGKISAGSQAQLLMLQEEPLAEPIPVIASLSDAHNPWQDFAHTLNYKPFEVTHDKHS